MLLLLLLLLLLLPLLLLLFVCVAVPCLRVVHTYLVPRRSSDHPGYLTQRFNDQ